MALDGACLHHLQKEIWDRAKEARIDKIYQPNRDELVFVLRTRKERMNLLLSARANSARVHFTQVLPENPAQPPMFCMLLRKRFTGGRLLRVEQPGLERLLVFVFDTVNELGDHVEMRLVAEVMGRYSNVILVDPEGKIVDSLRRVDADMSSERWILPGLAYRLPPPQDKLCLLDTEPEAVLTRMDALPRDFELSKALLQVLQGVSPIVCRELAFQVGKGAALTAKTMTDGQREKLLFLLHRLKETVMQASGTPFMVVSLQKKPMDFSFFHIGQYGSSAIERPCDSFSQLLDDFYTERDTQERMRVREQDLLRLLTTVSERLSRKIANQTAELTQSANRDQWRIMGDLLSANQYQIQKGSSRVVLPNFYSENGEEIEIPLDPALTPNQNAQKYYKEYRKARTAEEKLTEADCHCERRSFVFGFGFGRAEPGTHRKRTGGDPLGADGTGVYPEDKGEKDSAPAAQRAASLYNHRWQRGISGPEQPAKRPAHLKNGQKLRHVVPCEEYAGFPRDFAHERQRSEPLGDGRSGGTSGPL